MTPYIGVHVDIRKDKVNTNTCLTYIVFLYFYTYLLPIISIYTITQLLYNLT